VHGKRALISQMPGDYWQQFANLRLLYGYQYAMPGKKLLFMGGEFGQWTEWNHDAQLDWALFGHQYHDSLRRYIGDLNHMYKSQPALYETDFESAGFEWVQCDDWQNSVFAFIRKAHDPADWLLCVYNFTPVPRDSYRIGVPRSGFYKEVLNSDASIYGGGNIGNIGGRYSEAVLSHGRGHSVSLRLPPLGMVLLKPV
ncbi:MAG: alpha amylase C-terminal domain-containing protein, partial [Planctomycetaceae bacterium]